MSRNPRRMMDRGYNERSSLNPWEGGFAPGGAGLLPTPSGSNLLNQLSSPEAQLAVASNLLSSLLRPVTGGFQNSNQLPALMGMGNSGNFGNFGNQQSYRDNFSPRGFNDYQGGSRRSFEFRSRSPVRNTPTKRGQQTNKGRQSGSQSKSRSSPDPKDSKRDKKDSSSKDEKKGASFEGLPKAAFHCHVCKKDMWDAKSFDNHVKGMAHQKMLGEREKGYVVKAQLMRHEAKLEEQQNEIELERLVRMGKKPAPSRREYCKMCDFDFFGDISSHRKSKVHQLLKSFLHPKCQSCEEEFSLRIDLDKHLVSATHLKVVFKDKLKPTEKKSKEDGDKMDVEGEKTTDGKETEGAQGGDIDMKDAEESEEEPEVYNPDKAVGEEYLVAVTGSFCKACRRFFLDDDINLESHCRTPGHFNNYIALKQAAAAQKAAEAKKEAAERQKQKEEDAEEKVEEHAEEEEEEEEEEEGEGRPPVKRDPSDDLENEPKRMRQDDEYDPTEETPYPEEEEEGVEQEEEQDTTIKMEQLDKNIDDLEAVVKNEQPVDKTPRARRGRSTGRGRGRAH